jgi:hypothetical protein
MKKIYLISAAVLSILAAVSCEKEIEQPDSIRTTISATIVSSKTALGDKVGDSWPNYWKEGDIISVNGTSSEALGSAADGNSTATFTFSGVINTPYCAAYPASAVSGYSAGSATVTVPATQSYVAGTYDPAAFVMCGKSTNADAVSISPFVSVFHLSLTGTASISKVRLTGASTAALSGAFTTDFSGTYTPGTVSNTVELVASTAVALPAEFFICVPSGLSGSVTVEAFDSDGGSMTKHATISTPLVAGQMNSPAAIAYTPTNNITITAEGITSSTAVICWDNAPAAAYTISVYSDSGCTALVDSYAVDAGNACWGGESPRFCISGLTPNTAYYVKVVNPDTSAESNVLTVTTSDFTVVEVSIGDADVNDVILAEDFGELRWDSDLIGRGVGYFATSQTSFANTEVLQFLPIDTNSEKVLSSQSSALSASRLAHWAQGANANLYIHPGYIKLVGSKKVTHIVTPALDNIPDGKLATVEVEVTASPYFSESSASFCTTDAIVAVQTGSLNELTDETKTNTLDLTTNKQDITLDAASAWKTYKVTLTNVVKGNRIAFGAADGVSGNDARMLLSDIKITVKALDDPIPPTLTVSLENVSSSTAAFSWTYGESAAADTAKAYTASLYSNSACTDLVVSHSFKHGASCWGANSPCFSFGGLAPSTTYWLVVEDTTDSVTADPVSATTDPFTVVDATTVTGASAGDVILAEDFSEIGWGPDILGVAAGFEPSTKAVGAPSGVNPSGSFIKYDNTGSRFFGSGVDLGTSRLSKGWGFFGNSSVYLDNGYTRVGASGGRTHIVTPALSGIPAGKVATLDVTITATKYDSSIDISVFAEKGLTMNSQTNTSEASYRKYTGASLNVAKASSFGITTTKNWQTKTARISNVDSECQLIIGSLENHDNKNRFYISDVTVTIVSMKDIGAVDQVIEISDFDTFKAFLTACVPGMTIQGNVTADITLTSEQLADIDALYPVAEFDGIVNGNGHTIAGLTKPLFDVFSGTASNLTLNSTLNITDAQDEVGIFAKSAENATLTGCVSMGSITHASSTEVDGDLIIGGLIGSVSGSTLTACHNLANVTNTTTATDYVKMGGLIGVADGANTLTGTSSEYNYNKSIILENSASSKVAVGGVCGYTFGAASDFAYAQYQIQDGDDVDDIVVKDNTRDKVYVGGIIGMSANTSSFDYASNVDGDVCLHDLTMSATGQVFAGGIIGGWTESGPQTITGCSNSGWVYTKRHADSNKYYDDISVGETPTPLWSLFGGIAGMGSTGTSEGLNGGFNTITGKTFTNCTMSGRILIYCKVRCCIGGVVAYTENDPNGCVCTNNIRLYKNGGIGTVGSNYHRQIVGGVVGYFNGSSATNLKYDGTINTQSSSPFAYTSGVIGYLDTSEVELNNCRIGGSVRAAGTGQGRNAVMCHNNTNTVSVTFTNCLIKKGTISYATGSKVTISADSDVTAGQCMGASDTGYTIEGDVLPTVADSI